MEKKTIDHVLRTTWQAVAKMYNDQALKHNSTMAVGFALLSIDPKKGTPSTSLGPKMGMETTSLSRTLKSMEEKKFIQRKPNPDDGRGVLIYLTELGKTNRDASKLAVKKFNQAIIDNTGEESIENFHLVIEKINELTKDKGIFTF
ncbi:MAG: MarR family transcriptional regulator [Bacteroidetes bacterium]|nr:MarR family transcriptional regulator [Bacteroidota bacterium]MDA1019444.1 MarR family transcriptional regulator [Bacteroidota bacterium]